MAIVYKARDVILNRNVAVKVLRDEFTTDEEFIKREIKKIFFYFQINILKKNHKIDIINKNNKKDNTINITIV